MKASFKPQTLRNSRQFRRVYDQGYRFHAPFFSAFILRNDDGEQRYGITATRKIGGAVVRNRCKRRLREIVRMYESCATPSAHSASPADDACAAHAIGFDMVLNVKSGLAEADFKQLQESFSQVMSRFCDRLKKQGG